MSDPTREGRIRAFYVNRGTILDLMNHGGFNGNLTRVYCIPRIEGLPKDAYVCSVEYDWQRMAFRFCVASMEHTPVADGALVPEIDVKIDVIKGVHPESVEPYARKGQAEGDESLHHLA